MSEENRNFAFKTHRSEYMEEKKSYKADLEHRRPMVFAVAVVAVTAILTGVLFIPFSGLGAISMDFFDDYSMDLDLKANEQDDMIAAAVPQQQQAEDAATLNKVDEATELAPEQIDPTQQQQQDDKVEKTEEQPPVNINGDDEETLRIVQQLPEYPGGMVEFMKWLTATLKYPDAALTHKQQGKVMISFIVEKDGEITQLKVIKSAGQLFDDEAMRVAKLMPPWKPGTSEGKPCRTMVAIPIVFEM